MNRRFFLSALSAIAAAPALPAMAVPVSSKQMVTAKIIARAHNRCTPGMLARHLKVSPEVAGRVQAQLLRQGVITAPVSGVSLATNPTNTGCIPNEAMKPNNLLQKAAQLREKLNDIMPETEPPASTPADHPSAMHNDQPATTTPTS